MPHAVDVLGYVLHVVLLAYVRFLAVWKSKKHANREPNSYNHLGAFYVTCFSRVCEIFTVVVSELQRGPHVVL